MTPNEVLHDDELLLARLACSKLAGMVKGLVSVGIGLCSAARPQATEFLSTHLENIKSFAVVLQCVGGKPADLLYQLKERANKIRLLLDAFQQNFLALANTQELAPDKVREAADSLANTYAELCQALQDFADLIGLEADFAKDKDVARRMVDELLLNRQKILAST